MFALPDKHPFLHEPDYSSTPLMMEHIGSLRAQKSESGSHLFFRFKEFERLGQVAQGLLKGGQEERNLL